MPKVRIPQILWAAALSIMPTTMLAGATLGGGPARTTSTSPAKMATVAPEPAGTLDLSYEMRFWFIPFGHTTYRGIFVNNTYQASSYFKTSGLVSVFWQAEIDASASGNVGGHNVAPAVYDSYYRRGSEKKQRVKLTYKPDQPPELLAAPAYDIQKYPVPPEEQTAGVDPMSAVTLIVAGLRADENNPCGTVAPVFDGRRRYNIDFSFIKDQPVKLDNGIYNGTAHLCEMRYRQIAGYKPKMLKEGQAWPPIYALVANIADARAPLGRYLVPLKLWAKTSWGTVTVDLSKLKTGSAADKS